ncbi:hypothetical protein PR048_024498 [Dryococelus australis]|uniref:Uncharacterized protein n=1 Tax=Dryococelus australis TaxID=614101 RepID=A0ABQ9GNT9_9NEOP|nr:hypothetical protein PR048_024498 [Dryococelus australis]
MQRLDIAVYGPLKLCFEQAICNFHKNYPGRIVSQYDVAKLFSSAYLRVASAQNAISVFRSSGVWPYNPHISSDVDFAPASVTYRPEHEYASDIRDGLSETTSLPAFAPGNPNCDSASNVHSGQSTTFSLPAPFITTPDPGSSTDIRKFYSETGSSPSISSPPQPETAKSESCFGDKSPCQREPPKSSYSPVRMIFVLRQWLTGLRLTNVDAKENANDMKFSLTPLQENSNVGEKKKKKKKTGKS